MKNAPDAWCGGGNLKTFTKEHILKFTPYDSVEQVISFLGDRTELTYREILVLLIPDEEKLELLWHGPDEDITKAVLRRAAFRAVSHGWLSNKSAVLKKYYVLKADLHESECPPSIPDTIDLQRALVAEEGRIQLQDFKEAIEKQ